MKLAGWALRRRVRPAAQVAGAVLLLPLLSMCTTLGPRGLGEVAATQGKVPPASPSVSSLRVPSAPKVSGSLRRGGSAGLPEPTLPANLLVPSMPLPRRAPQSAPAASAAFPTDRTLLPARGSEAAAVSHVVPVPPVAPAPLHAQRVGAAIALPTVAQHSSGSAAAGGASPPAPSVGRASRSVRNAKRGGAGPPSGRQGAEPPSARRGAGTPSAGQGAGGPSVSLPLGAVSKALGAAVPRVRTPAGGGGAPVAGGAPGGGNGRSGGKVARLGTGGPTGGKNGSGARPASRGGAGPPASSPRPRGTKPPTAAAGHQVTRTVYARVGDDITISLSGTGWTFSGGVSSGERWKQGVGFRSRSVTSGGTSFVFKAKARGKWLLRFERKVTSAGSSGGETIRVDVLTNAAFKQMLAKAGSSAGTGSSRNRGSQSGGGGVGGGGSASGSDAGGRLARAEWLYREGKYREALKAFENASRPGDPALSQKIAALAYRIGDYAQAKKYWKKNLSLRGSSYGGHAVAGLVKVAVARKNAPALRALFDTVRSVKGVPLRAELLAAGRFLVAGKEWSPALAYLKEFLKRYEGKGGTDEADYLIGQIYEADSPMQNAQKALSYFRRVVTSYPESSYYDRARANIVYLRRQYLEIR